MSDEINKVSKELSLALSERVDAGILEEIVSLFNSGVLTLKMTLPKTKYDPSNSRLSVSQCYRIDFIGREKISQLEKENTRLQEEIDKRDAIIKKCLSILRELEDERYGDVSWLTFNEAEDLVSEIEELNGVKDE